MHRIADILRPEEVAAIRTALEGDAIFADGGETAGWHARAVKSNQQARTKAIKGPLAKIERALAEHDLFQAVALPRRLISLRLTRYGVGDRYGTHTDNAIIDGARADLSFTLFLSEPETYDGGELIIDTAGEEIAVKMPPGHLVIYGANTLHRVAPVTSGVRLAANGWVRSLIRRADQREVLTDLALLMRRAHTADGKTEEFDLLAKTRSNLLRMWAED